MLVKHYTWVIYNESFIIKGSDALSETWVTFMTSNADGKNRLTEFIGSWAFAYRINIWASIWICNRFLILNKCIFTWWDPDLHKIIQVWFVVHWIHFWWLSFMWKIMEHHGFHFIQFWTISRIIRDLRSVDYGLSGRKKAKLTVNDAVEFVNLCSTEKIVDGKKRVQTIWKPKRSRSHH